MYLMRCERNWWQREKSNIFVAYWCHWQAGKCVMWEWWVLCHAKLSVRRKSPDSSLGGLGKAFWGRRHSKWNPKTHVDKEEEYSRHTKQHVGISHTSSVGPAKVFDVSRRFGIQRECMMHQILPAGPRDLIKLPRWGGSYERNWGSVRLEARLVSFRLLEVSDGSFRYDLDRGWRRCVSELLKWWTVVCHGCWLEWSHMEKRGLKDDFCFYRNIFIVI